MAQSTARAIATQSQIKLVMDYMNTLGYKVTTRDLVRITNVFVDFVEDGWTKELGDRLEAIDKYLQETYTKED